MVCTTLEFVSIPMSFGSSSMWEDHGSYRSPAMDFMTSVIIVISISVKSRFTSRYSPRPPSRRSIIVNVIVFEICTMTVVSLTSSFFIPISTMPIRT